MTAAVNKQFVRRSDRIRTKCESIVNRRNFCILIKAVITGPVAEHRRVTVAKMSVNFVIVPIGKLFRNNSLAIKPAEQAERPGARFVFDVGDKIFGKKRRARHLRELIKSSEKPRLFSRKKKTVAAGRRIIFFGDFKQFVPRRGW